MMDPKNNQTPPHGSDAAPHAAASQATAGQSGARKAGRSSNGFPKKRRRGFWLKLFLALMLMGFAGAIALIAFVYAYFSRDLPDFRSLSDYRPWQITKVYANDGSLITEYAKEKRIYVPISEIPQPLINAFLAAEDSSFYSHGGFDIKGIIRAMLVNLMTDRLQGASTITQQVAKTFLLSSERTYTRKVKELILARRIENAFSKDEILDLYLNQIYLGNGAYGVAAAAKTYFNKKLTDLTIAERALLAGLPKAPSRFNPYVNPLDAKWRRDIIIGRMLTENQISPEDAQQATLTPLALSHEGNVDPFFAPHYSEYIRRTLENEYGSDALYTHGFSIFTTLDPTLQRAAQKAVVEGTLSYDKRHGFRGPLTTFEGDESAWQEELQKLKQRLVVFRPYGEPVVVLHVDDAAKKVTVGVSNGSQGSVAFEDMAWAKKFIDQDTVGEAPSKPSDLVKRGDVIVVKEKVRAAKEGTETPVTDAAIQHHFTLSQIPNVQAALVAIDNNTGGILAMVGGTDEGTGFNRAIQAQRQPGSAFKPFVYALALNKGYTPASLVLDAPVVIREGDFGKTWKPQNISKRFYGNTTLRRGVELSRNLMTIRLAQDLGINNLISYTRAFGLTGTMQKDLSTSLGSGSFNLMEMTAAYSVFPNGGLLRKPFSITSVQDGNGRLLSSHIPPCYTCMNPKELPETPVDTNAIRVMDAPRAYQMTDILRGVIQRGTGGGARGIKRPLGGKTGSTNDYIDAWFVGFSPEITLGVWIGFDTPTTLGVTETGAKAALPIWVNFMQEADKTLPRRSYSIPDGLVFVRIDAESGKRATPDSKRTLMEAFIPGTEPALDLYDGMYSQEKDAAPVSVDNLGIF